ncbi:hypothetical protein KR768_02715, partial [Staphylococcus aureus]|nr:hypothetical protein [Staphylococcus aureus]
SLAGPQQREIGFPNSTGNASWRGPNKEKLDSQILQAMQVGGAPTKRNWIPNFYRQCKLGWDDEINFAKISFLSHSHQKNDIEKNIKVWCHNFLSAQ